MEDQNDQSGDRLLWLAAGGIAFMGLAWLVVEAPWTAPEPAPFEEIATAMPDPITTAVQESAASVAAAPVSSDPLHMAQMALDAGMLIEPSEYSAWTLFGRVAASTPDNEAAHDGLEQVATALLQRGNAALEQGRYEDASLIVTTIEQRLPEHEGLARLSTDIARATAPPPPVVVAARPVREVVVNEPVPIDPMPPLNTAFRDAMAQNSILQPAGTSALDLVNEMVAIAPDHEMTIAARELLVTEMLDRSKQSIEALDVRSAQTWIDSAAPLAADPGTIDRAQNVLTQHLISAETARILPASDFTQVYSAAPTYPRIPLERGIEGWVEIEFVVTTFGTSENVTITDASHDRYFREEAIAAVSEWRFEPFIFMNRPIPKRAHTRLSFVLD